MTLEGQAWEDAEYLESMDWHNRLSPQVLRWIATRVKLVTTDPDALRDLGLWDPNNPGKTKALGAIGSPYSFEAFESAVLDWQAKTFPDKSSDSVQSHIREEIREFLDVEVWGTDAWAEEAADILMLLIANLNEHGYSLVKEVRGKFAIVQTRKYAPSDRGHWKAVKEGEGNGDAVTGQGADGSVEPDVDPEPTDDRSG